MRFQQLKHDSNVVEKKKMYKSGKTWVVMSSLAVVGGFTLFGVGNGAGTVVQAADVGSASSVVGDTDDNTYKLVHSESPDADMTDYDWGVYSINGNDHNLQLRIGNVGLTYELLSLQDDSTPYWSRYAQDITEVEVDGVLNSNKEFSGLFKSLPNVKKISGLNNINVDNATTITHLFDGDRNLTSIDISDWNMSKVTSTNSNFAGTDMLSSLTLGKNSVLHIGDLPTTYTKDGVVYKIGDWQNSSDSSEMLNSEELAGKYAATSTQESNFTWIPVGTEVAPSYYVQYFDAGKMDGDSIYSDTAKLYPGNPGEYANLTNNELKLSSINHLIAGYSADSVTDTSAQIVSDGNDGYMIKVGVQKLDPVNISVSQQIGSDKATDASFTIPVNDTEYTYDNSVSDPSNTKLDTAKSTIKIGDAEQSFDDYIAANPDLTDKSVNAVISYAINAQLQNKANKVFGDADAGTTPITVNAVYTKDSTSGGGSSSGGGSNSSNNNNNSDADKGTTTKVKQTVGTTTKVVNVYDKKGKLITNRALAKNTGWLSDQEYKLNGTPYYRVATNEYVKASDVYVYVSQKNIVRVHDDRIGYLVDSKGNKITNRALKESTDWVTDRYTTINGEKYYRVATNEFVNESYVSLV